MAVQVSTSAYSAMQIAPLFLLPSCSRRKGAANKLLLATQRPLNKPTLNPPRRLPDKSPAVAPHLTSEGHLVDNKIHPARVKRAVASATAAAAAVAPSTKARPDAPATRPDAAAPATIAAVRSRVRAAAATCGCRRSLSCALPRHLRLPLGQICVVLEPFQNFDRLWQTTEFRGRNGGIGRAGGPMVGGRRSALHMDREIPATHPREPRTAGRSLSQTNQYCARPCNTPIDAYTYPGKKSIPAPCCRCVAAPRPAPSPRPRGSTPPAGP